MDVDPGIIAVATIVGTGVGAAIAEFRRARQARAAEATAQQPAGAEPAPAGTPTPAPALEAGPPDSGIHAAPSASQEALARAQIAQIHRWTRAEAEHRAHDTMARQTILQTAEATQAIAIAVDRLREDGLSRDRRRDEAEHALERRLVAHVDRAIDRMSREHSASVETILTEIRLRGG